MRREIVEAVRETTSPRAGRRVRDDRPIELLSALRVH